jgi:hypothetical protein
MVEHCPVCHGDGETVSLYTDGTPSRSLEPCVACDGTGKLLPKLIHQANRFREIGKTIASLAEESKALRSAILLELQGSTLNPDPEGRYEFIFGNTLWNVFRAEKEVTVLYRDVEQLESDCGNGQR